ncbi:MAG: phenylacetate--CoA ligase family protein [Desulfuromonadales bacterium]
MLDLQAAMQQEFVTPDQHRKHQGRLLREQIAYLAARSPYYRQMFERKGINPGTIRSPADLAALPFTSKEDIERAPRTFHAVDEREFVDLCLTSGTLGAPIVVPQTAADLDRLADNEALAFLRMGLDSSDRVLVAVALERCFMAGLAYFLGLTRISASAIRGGSGSIAHLADLVKSQRPTAIVGVPSLLHALAELLAGQGFDPANAGVTRLLCIGEPVRSHDFGLSPLGRRLQQRWQAEIFGTYASTELATAFTDCPAGTGGHLLPDLIVVEIVDDNGQPLPAGIPGEVVVTPLRVTGMPLLRYRTGDIAALYESPCACGRATPRLGPVLGRLAQRLKVRGTTVYPSAVFNVLQGFPTIDGYYLEVFDDFEMSSRLRVTISSNDVSLTGDRVAGQLSAQLRVRPEVAIISQEELRKRTHQEGHRKPVLFFDHRQFQNLSGDAIREDNS